MEEEEEEEKINCIICKTPVDQDKNECCDCHDECFKKLESLARMAGGKIPVYLVPSRKEEEEDKEQ